MFYEPLKRNHGLPHDPIKAIIAPRPIGWISAMDRAGRINLAPYSFFNMVGDHPPIVMFSSGGLKDAASFAAEGGEFVCSIAGWDQRHGMNQSSAPYPRGVSEFGPSGLEAAPSRLVKPPRVKGAPAALECKFLKLVELEDSQGRRNDYVMVLGEVVGVHVEDQFVVGGRVDTAAMRIIARAGYHDYFLADHRFELPRPDRV